MPRHFAVLGVMLASNHTNSLERKRQSAAILPIEAQREDSLETITPVDHAGHNWSVTLDRPVYQQQQRAARHYRAHTSTITA
jgi:hypothetical protein